MLYLPSVPTLDDTSLCVTMGERDTGAKGVGTPRGWTIPSNVKCVYPLPSGVGEGSLWNSSSGHYWDGKQGHLVGPHPRCWGAVEGWIIWTWLPSWSWKCHVPPYQQWKNCLIQYPEDWPWWYKGEEVLRCSLSLCPEVLPSSPVYSPLLTLLKSIGHPTFLRDGILVLKATRSFLILFPPLKWMCLPLEIRELYFYHRYS